MRGAVVCIGDDLEAAKIIKRLFVAIANYILWKRVECYFMQSLHNNFNTKYFCKRLPCDHIFLYAVYRPLVVRERHMPCLLENGFKFRIRYSQVWSAPLCTFLIQKDKNVILM